MNYVFANFDKEQYVRPLALGAAPARKGRPVLARSDLRSHVQWLTLVELLLEAGPPRKKKTLAGSWAGDRVAVVRADDTTVRFAEDGIALYALAGERLTTYGYVLRHFKNVTRAALSLGSRQGLLGDEWFELMSRPRSFYWLTVGEAASLMDEAREGGDAYHRNYLAWLRDCPTARPAVRRLAEARLDEAERARCGGAAPALTP